MLDKGQTLYCISTKTSLLLRQAFSISDLSNAFTIVKALEIGLSLKVITYDRQRKIGTRSRKLSCCCYLMWPKYVKAEKIKIGIIFLNKKC